MTTESLLSRLENLLEEITSLCRSLCGVLERERRTLISPNNQKNNEDLTGLLQEKKEVLRRIAAAEEERRTGMLDLRKTFELKSENPTLSELAAKLDTPQASRLADLKDRLLASM